MIRVKIGMVSLLIVTLGSCRKDKTPEPPIAENPVVCVEEVSFAQKVLPVLQDKCFSCHANGTSPAFNDHATVSQQADKIVKSIKAEGTPLMPQGGPALPDSIIQNIECWRNQGKLNN